jgi:hypothetical protein
MIQKKKKEKKPARRKPVTRSEVRAWIGDSWDLWEVAGILAEIANGEYKPEELREDIEALRE